MQDSVQQKNLNLCRTVSNKKFNSVQLLDAVLHRIIICRTLSCIKLLFCRMLSCTNLNFCRTLSNIKLLFCWTLSQQRQVSNIGAVGNGTEKGNVGKVGKVSNISAVGHSSDKLENIMLMP